MSEVAALDPINRQTRDAKRALRARDQFARLNPGLPPLPLNYAEREQSKRPGGTLAHALALFARSLESWDYDLDHHPSFDAYMRGLLCSPHLRSVFAGIADAYPPQPLVGLTPGQSYVLQVTRRRREGGA
jgi:hypothetical protein